MADGKLTPKGSATPTEEELNAILGSIGLDPSKLGNAAGATSGTGETIGTVYMPGTKKKVQVYNPHFERMETITQGGYEETTYDVVRNLPTAWDPATLKEFVNKGIMYGIPGFDVGMGMPEIVAAWQQLVKDSASISTVGKKWTPWDIMDSYGSKDSKFGTMRKGDWVYDIATGERLSYVGKTTRTTKSERVDLSSPEEIQALVTQVLREALGRAPNAKELAQFKATISGFEQKNPEVTTVTETATAESIEAAKLSGGDVFTGATQQATTSGGVTDAARAALVTSPTQKTQEYGKFQAGTTYWDAMMQMIGGS